MESALVYRKLNEGKCRGSLCNFTEARLFMNLTKAIPNKLENRIPLLVYLL